MEKNKRIKNPEILKTIKATRVTGMTMLGVHAKDFPIERGNCFHVKGEDLVEYKIVNFVLENLEYLEEKGIQFPFQIQVLAKHVAVMADTRIPHNFYQDKFCSVCCPESMLTLPQRLEIWRQEETGERITKEHSIHYDFSKQPKL